MRLQLWTVSLRSGVGAGVAASLMVVAMFAAQPARAIAPDAPFDVTATLQQGPSVAVYWNETSRVWETGFKIERRVGAGSVWEEVGETGTNTGSFSGNLWLDEDLPPGDLALYYRVRAYTTEDPADHSDYSETAQAVAAPTTDNFSFPVGDDTEGWATYTRYGTELQCDNRVVGAHWYVASDVLSPGYTINGAYAAHPGEDWNGTCFADSDRGVPVRSIARGRVVFAGKPPSAWGNTVLVAHRQVSGRTVYSMYTHLEEIAPSVAAGGTVAYRQPIGTLGTGEGRFTAHLHFEIRRQAVAAGAWWGADDAAVRERYLDPSDRGADDHPDPGFLEVIVQEDDDGFSRSGPTALWQDQWIGNAYHGYWASATGDGEDAASGLWAADLSSRGDGFYQVYAYVTPEHSTTTQATYRVWHAGGLTEVVIDQSAHPGDWVSLGVYPFEAHWARVELSSETGEAAGSTEVAFDGMRWRKRLGARPLDLVFAIDSTGSMWDDIAQIRRRIIEVSDRLFATSDLTRVSVIDYKDFPYFPYGWSTDYPYRADLPFTDDAEAIHYAVRGLSASGGADWPESVYTALMKVIQTEGIGAWRGEARKVIILLADAPPHDPEPFTGYRLADITAAAEAVGVELDADGAPLPKAARVEGKVVVDPPEDDYAGVRIYPILVGFDGTAAYYFSRLADGTHGELYHAANAGEVVDAILAVIGGIEEPPPGNQPPDCTAARASVATLWPANHKLHEVRVLDVTDPDGEVTAITVTAIRQNEPVDARGSGKGGPDGDGVGTDSALVRAERSGTGEGRVYEIFFQAIDDAGGECTGSVYVCVPHDQGVNTVCPTDGIVYDSTASSP